MHNPKLQAYFRLNEGVGDTLKDIATGTDSSRTNRYYFKVEVNIFIVCGY